MTKRSKKRYPLGAALLWLAALTGCGDMGFQTMEAGEYGVVFTQLPLWLGGGVRESVVGPGEKEFVYPWEELYRVDTSLRDISWGTAGGDYVETRAADGNEVGLSITIRYRVDPEKVRHVVQKVGTDNDQIRDLVAAVALADIRTHMNILTTRQFFSQSDRQKAVDQVKESMERRLEPEGVLIEAVVYQDHRFERAMGEGVAPDRRYQEQIDLTQAKYQEAEQEGKRRAALIQDKGREDQEVRGRVNRMVESAKGYKRQAKTRGDAYLAQRTNEAQQILAAGLNEVEGMKKRIEALSGPGGEAILRLDIARALVAKQPKFLLLNSGEGGQNEVGVNRIDTNELLKQMGIFAAAHEGMKESPENPIPTDVPLPSAPSTMAPPAQPE